MNPAPRIGCVRYLNARPLIHAAPEGAIETSVPAELAGRLDRGELDAALVPLYFVLRHPEYYVADGVAIGCRGPVHSVVIAYQGELEDIRTLQLSAESMTSNALARIVLAARGIQLRMASANLDGGPRVVIGDEAIALRASELVGLRFLDLGAEWLALTGLPFVFAVWAIRPEFAGPGRLAMELRSWARKGLANLNDVVRGEDMERRAFARIYLTQYIRHELGEEQKRAIREFQRRCTNHSLVEEQHELLYL